MSGNRGLSLNLPLKTKLVWFAVVLLCVVGTLNYSGVCIPAGKILSNEEKIRATIGYRLQKYPPAAIRTPVGDTGGWSNSPPEKPILYKDVDEFLQINPDCCQLTKQRNPEEGGAGPTQRATGTTSGYIKLNYQVRYWEGGITKSVTYAEHIPISNCGKPAKSIDIYSSIQLFLGFNPANLFN